MNLRMRHHRKRETHIIIVDIIMNCGACEISNEALGRAVGTFL